MQAAATKHSPRRLSALYLIAVALLLVLALAAPLLAATPATGGPTGGGSGPADVSAAGFDRPGATR